MAAVLVQAAVELGGDVQQLVQQGLHPLPGAGAKELGAQRDAVERAFPEQDPGVRQRLMGPRSAAASPATKRPAHLDV